MTIRLINPALTGVSQEWNIPAEKFSEALFVTIGATGGFRIEDNVMITTPMKKHVGLLVRNLNRALK